MPQIEAEFLHARQTLIAFIHLCFGVSLFLTTVKKKSLREWKNDIETDFSGYTMF